MTTISPKTRISALLPASLTEELRRVSMDENITQSSIIERALRGWLRNKLDKDTKQLSGMVFIDLPSEEDWASLQSEIERHD